MREETTINTTALRAEIEGLRHMTVGHLKDKYREVFCEESRSNHKQFLFRRVAWRDQANAEGGLSERTRRRALEIADDADLRIRAPKNFLREPMDRSLASEGRVSPMADPRLPAPGTLLVRRYRGKDVVFRVRQDGFECDGRLYPSLSAAVREVTGMRCNGFAFFDLPRRVPDEPPLDDEPGHRAGPVRSRYPGVVNSVSQVCRAGGSVTLAALAAGIAVWLSRAAAPAETDPIQFEDIAARAGIEFVLQNSATPERRQIETMVSGVAVFDFNNDGRPDIYFVNGARQPGLEKTDASYYNRLYCNDGGGRFTDITLQARVRGEGFVTGVAAADYDNDGFTDLFLAGVNRNILYRNRGDGTFEDVTQRAGLTHDPAARKPWSISAGWFDYDNDGWLDLFVVNYCVWIPEKEPPCTIGKARTYCHPKYYAGLPNNLYRNNGNGTFTDVSGPSGIAAHIGKGMAASFLDFDQDGRLDVFVANDTVPNFLFRNQGEGRFREVGLEAGVAFNDDGRAVSSMGVDARDIDNDGREDLFVVANNNETFPLFRNLGKGMFTDITYPSGVGRQTLAYTGWSNGIYDFNNDGHKDLFAACGAIDDNVEEFSHRKSRHPNLVLANLGNRRFLDVSQRAGKDFQQAAWHRGAAFGDFDADGRVDVVISRIGEPAELFRNTSPARNHWLALRLRGRRSNRDGIGALVRVAGTAGREQWNRVTTATGYGSSSDRTVFFGMGQDAAARLVEILWPSGVRQTLQDVACDRYLTVEEP